MTTTTHQQHRYRAPEADCAASEVATGTTPNLGIPILVPESPLINLLAQMTQAQRNALRRVHLTPALGYDTQQIFDNAEQLYRWLTPGRRVHTGDSWPAEAFRKKGFRKDITGRMLLAAARPSTYSQRIETLVGHAEF